MISSLHSLPNIRPLLPWLLILVAGAAVFGLLLWLGYKVFVWRRLLKQDLVFLELTPPASVAKSSKATLELFKIIHGFKPRSLRDKLLGRKIVLSLEIHSTKEQGIRFMIGVHKKFADSLQQALISYLPQMKLAEVESESLGDKPRVIEFKQTGHYAFPLASHGMLDQHDPIAYLVGTMTKLKPAEGLSFQLVVEPVQIRAAAMIARRILGNEDLLSDLSSRKVPFLSHVTKLMNKFLLGLTSTANEVYHGSTKESFNIGRKEAHEKLQAAKRLRPSRTLSAFELELMETIHRKVNQPLFSVSIRAAVRTDGKAEGLKRLAAVKSALQSYNVPAYQSLQIRRSLPFIRRLRAYAFRNRLPALLPRNSLVLSSSELAALYHFPDSSEGQTDNLVASLSRTLPAPVSLKQNKELDVVIGQNEHHGSQTPIGLTEAERERHIYIIGGTGNGKTTMLQYQIVQDMQKNKGLAVIDPHGDMAEMLLKHVPDERMRDVIYFNPDDLDYPIGLNMLEPTPGLSGNELLREKDIITESVISVFRKIFSEEDTGGHRIEYVLRNAIHTALTVEGATIFTVLKLLQNAKFRKKVTSQLEDEDLKDFWKSELGQAGNMQRVKMSAGITAKIGRFNSNAAAKLILGQEKSTIDFEDIINSGKILICNFSKGLLGEDVSELFGITILAKLQLASLRRARIQQENRRPFYLYVDEFQNFATASFVQMLSESRKYKLFMTMAEQSTSQQKDQQMVSVILANVGTVICFRTGNPQDERLLLPLFSPYIEQGEIANLSAFNFYARLSAIKAQEPLSGQTLLVEDAGNIERLQQVVTHSRENYAQKESPKEQTSESDVPIVKSVTGVKLPGEA